MVQIWRVSFRDIEGRRGTRVVPRENLGGSCAVGHLLENEQGMKKFDRKTHYLKAQYSKDIIPLNFYWKNLN